MNFASDTSSPAHPNVLRALEEANLGSAPSYGSDIYTMRAAEKLAEFFETDVSVFFTSSGTAANALVLSILCPPTGAILCHEEAHIDRDERGAPEFFTGGAKLQLLPGDHGKIHLETLIASLANRDPDFVHETPAHVLSLTNLTECGTAYAPTEISALTSAAKTSGLNTHLDGARLANVLASTGHSAADMTWRAGIEAVTFGSTKNGTIGCEAIVLFGDLKNALGDLRARAKRAGHMPPKMRFLSAQMVAYLEDGLWLDLAQKANLAAKRLGHGMCDTGHATLTYPIEGNEVFVALAEEAAERIRSAGATFYPWLHGTYRFVCSWNTTDEDVDRLIEVLSG